MPIIPPIPDHTSRDGFHVNLNKESTHPNPWKPPSMFDQTFGFHHSAYKIYRPKNEDSLFVANPDINPLKRGTFLDKMLVSTWKGFAIGTIASMLDMVFITQSVSMKTNLTRFLYITPPVMMLPISFTMTKELLEGQFGDCHSTYTLASLAPSIVWGFFRQSWMTGTRMFMGIAIIANFFKLNADSGGFFLRPDWDKKEFMTGAWRYEKDSHFTTDLHIQRHSGSDWLRRNFGEEPIWKRFVEQDEAAKLKAKEEDIARKKSAEEEAARLQVEEIARLIAEAEDAAKKKAEEEAAARLKAKEEEAAKLKAEEDEAVRVKAEEEIARTKAEEDAAAILKALEDEAARLKEEEEIARKKAEEVEEAATVALKAVEDEAARVKAEADEVACVKVEKEDEIKQEKAEDVTVKAEEVARPEIQEDIIGTESNSTEEVEEFINKDNSIIEAIEDLSKTVEESKAIDEEKLTEEDRIKEFDEAQGSKEEKLTSEDGIKNAEEEKGTTVNIEEEES